MNVLQLTKRLSEKPPQNPVGGIRLRTYQGTADIQPWLDLRHQAFARQPLGVAAWTPGDFEAEFLHKSWWQPDRLWLAEWVAEPARPPLLVGSVTLAMRGSGPAAKPVVHWLMVRPDWRRRGVARLLLQHLEAICWEAGYRQIWLETHAAWSAAGQFYERLGYRAEPPAEAD